MYNIVGFIDGSDLSLNWTSNSETKKEKYNLKVIETELRNIETNKKKYEKCEIFDSWG